METVFHIILFILFLVICIFAGWSFGSCISIDKKLKELSNTQLKLIKLLEEENNHCKAVINHCKTVINDNKTLLSHIENVTIFTKDNLTFIKQNMIRRKTPIND